MRGVTHGRTISLSHTHAIKLGSTPRRTQVQGPREEVTPLLLPVFCIIRWVGMGYTLEVEDEVETLKGGNELGFHRSPRRRPCSFLYSGGQVTTVKINVEA